MRILVVVIVATCVLVVAATIGTVVVGSRSFEGIVVDKPYETGLAWDEARKKRDRLGWKIVVPDARFKTGSNILNVIARDKNGSPLENAQVSVMVTRPSTRAYDRTYETVKKSGGRYLAGIELPLIGNWEIIIDVRRGDDRARYANVIAAIEEKK